MKRKHIHFVGIKGVGVAPLAIIAKEAGMAVSGCDIGEEFITDESLKKAGIVPLVGFDTAHISSDVSLVVTTGAHGGFDNEEVKFAKEKGLTVLTQGEAVGKVMDGTLFGKKHVGVSVAGSHGKTTTTAMIATVLKEAGLDPSYLIGTASAASLPNSGHFGKGKYFVAEADEYSTEPQYDKTAKLLWQHPKIAVITNLELDHPDLYPSEEDLVMVFREFIKNIPQDGVLILGGDDSNNRKLVESFSGRILTYGKSAQNTYVVSDIHVSEGCTFFWITTAGVSMGEFMVNVSGEHNALNAAAAVIAGLECGVPLETIKKGVRAFTGSKRRGEYKGTSSEGLLIFDDYAHHPTEIIKTLEAFRKSYPRAYIVCIFQPHTYSRTKALFNEFVHAFSEANEVILCDIYASLREGKDESVSSRLLAKEMSSIHKAVFYLPGGSNMVQYIAQKHYKRGSIIITMGAGDIYKIGNDLIKL